VLFSQSGPRRGDGVAYLLSRSACVADGLFDVVLERLTGNLQAFGGMLLRRFELGGCLR